MSKSLRICTVTIFLILGLGFNSCETELQIEGPGKNMPVIYSIIDPIDSIHYVRVNRVYRGSDGPFFGSQQPDSLCYPGLSPKLELYTPDGWKYREFVFEPVLTEGSESDLFSPMREQLYAYVGDISKLLLDKTVLKLNIDNGQGMMAAGVVRYYEPPKIVTPKQGIDSEYEIYQPYQFIVTLEDPPEFSHYYVIIRMHYSNVFDDGSSNNKFVDKKFELDSQNDTRRREEARLKLNIFGDVVFSQYGKEIGVTKDLRYRIVDEVEVILVTGSKEFFEVIRSQEIASDFGLQSSTNIINGLGVFAVKQTVKVDHIKWGSISLDSLINGRFTKHCKFVKK